MQSMETIQNRIRSARKAAKLTQAALGKLVGVSSQAVTMWETTDNRPSRDNIVRLAQALQVSEQWLLTGNISSLTVGNGGTSLPVTLLSGRAVRLMSISEASSDSQPEQHGPLVMTQFPCSELAFAITLEDDSNAPRFPRGCRLVIDPKRRPVPGSIVLAVDNGNTPFVGEFRQETLAAGVVVVVVPLNSKWPAYRSDVNGVSVIGTMTEYTISAQHI